jgi:hypothetical protein
MEMGWGASGRCLRRTGADPRRHGMRALRGVSQMSALSPSGARPLDGAHERLGKQCVVGVQELSRRSVHQGFKSPPGVTGCQGADGEKLDCFGC